VIPHLTCYRCASYSLAAAYCYPLNHLMHVVFLDSYLPCLSPCVYVYFVIKPALYFTLSTLPPSSFIPPFSSIPHFTLAPLSFAPTDSFYPPPSYYSPLNRPPRHSYLYSLFWVLCRLKVYLGATVLCIRTYTHDLHVYLAIFLSLPAPSLYPCIPPCLPRLVYIDVPWGDAYTSEDGWNKISASRPDTMRSVSFACCDRSFLTL